MGKINFQLVFAVVFGVIAILAFFVFSGFIPFPGGSENNPENVSGNVVVWGVLPQETVRPHFETFNDDILNVTYTQIPHDDFESKLLNALATNTGPDLVLWEHEKILTHQDKMLLVPYESISRFDYQQTFIRSAEIFLGEEGILAIPIIADPLVLFNNNRILASSFVANIPQSWAEVQDAVKSITRRTDSGQILQSGIAFGVAVSYTHLTLPTNREV